MFSTIPRYHLISFLSIQKAMMCSPGCNCSDASWDDSVIVLGFSEILQCSSEALAAIQWMKFLKSSIVRVVQDLALVKGMHSNYPHILLLIDFYSFSSNEIWHLLISMKCLSCGHTSLHHTFFCSSGCLLHHYLLCKCQFLLG